MNSNIYLTVLYSWQHFWRYHSIVYSVLSSLQHCLILRWMVYNIVRYCSVGFWALYITVLYRMYINIVHLWTVGSRHRFSLFYLVHSIVWYSSAWFTVNSTCLLLLCQVCSTIYIYSVGFTSLFSLFCSVYSIIYFVM